MNSYYVDFVDVECKFGLLFLISYPRHDIISVMWIYFLTPQSSPLGYRMASAAALLLEWGSGWYLLTDVIHKKNRAWLGSGKAAGRRGLEWENGGKD